MLLYALDVVGHGDLPGSRWTTRSGGPGDVHLDARGPTDVTRSPSPGVGGHIRRATLCASQHAYATGLAVHSTTVRPWSSTRRDTSERRVREAERRADVVHVERRVDLVAGRLLSARPRPCEVTRRHRRRHSRAARVRGRGPGRQVRSRGRRQVRAVQPCSRAHRRSARPVRDAPAVASPLPGRALAVVHEAPEPVRGRHGGDATRPRGSRCDP
jgi:DNA-binding transcriptional regulator YdaS (Cro superfamily)